MAVLHRDYLEDTSLPDIQITLVYNAVWKNGDCGTCTLSITNGPTLAISQTGNYQAGTFTTNTTTSQNQFNSANVTLTVSTPAFIKTITVSADNNDDIVYNIESGSVKTYNISIPTVTSQLTITVDEFYAGSWCVLYNTPIYLSDGTTKLAEDIEVGDKVISYDKNTFTFFEDEIIDISKLKSSKIYKILFDSDKYIELTEEHIILSSSGWKCINPYEINPKALPQDMQVYELGIGDMILTKDKQYATVRDIILMDYEDVDVYDFNVHLKDTFCAGELGIVCHNLC